MNPAPANAHRILRVDPVEIDLDAHLVRVHGEPVHVPEREYRVLCLLMDNAGRVLSRADILRQVWNTTDDVHKTIEVHINRLRRRIGAAAGRTPIRTVRGAGYVFDLPEHLHGVR